MRSVYVPSAVSCFFTFEGVNPDGSFSRPLDEVGARGGGFKLVKGTHTTAEKISSPADAVFFDGRPIANSFFFSFPVTATTGIRFNSCGICIAGDLLSSLIPGILMSRKTSSGTSAWTALISEFAS